MMKIAFLGLLPAILLITFGCGGPQDTDKCKGVVCDRPPDDACKDKKTRLVYDANGTCDPDTGDCEYGHIEENCPNGCAGGRCLDENLGDDFGLQIPPGTEACSLFSSTANSSDIFNDYAMKGRIRFREGLTRLPRDQDRLEADLIEQMELTPDRTVLEPAGAGLFTRELRGTPENGRYLYTYTAQFSSGGNTFRVSFDVPFDVKNSEPVQQVVVLDDKLWGGSMQNPRVQGTLTDSSTVVIDSRSYDICGYKGYNRKSEHDITASNGDTLHMDQLMLDEIVVEISPSALVKASFSRGSDQREVSDHFRLTYTAEHRNDHQQFLVIFDEPVGSIHGLYLYEEITNHPKIKKVNYLNADLEIIDSADITDYQAPDS